MKLQLIGLFLAVIIAFSWDVQSQTRNDRDTLNIWSLSLEEVLNLKVVAAQKTERAVNRIPASVIVITRKEIEQYGYLTLQEILNQVPGLYLWNGYHVRGRINIGIRGSTSSDNVIILVNGVNQVEGVYNEYLLTKVGVPVDAIDRIEVVRGPMSVMYGSGAFFGVINIITNDITPDSHHSVSAHYGSNQYKTGTVRAAINYDEMKVGLTASGYGTDGLNRSYSEMMSDPERLSNWGLMSESTSKGMLKDKGAYFNMTVKFKGFTGDMSHVEHERGGFLVQPTVQYSPTKRHSTNLMASYEHQFSEKVKLKGKFSYLNTNALAFYFLNEKNSYMSFAYNADAYEAELLSFIKPNEKLDLTFGLFHRNVYYATNPAELSSAWGRSFLMHLTRLEINSEMIENSLFTQVDYALSDKLEMIGGLRAQRMEPYVYQASGGGPFISQGRELHTETYEFKDIYLIPSLSFIYSMNKRHTLKLLYGEAIRNPPMGIIADILFTTATDETFDYPQLIPSKIRTYELNYNGVIGSNLSMHLSLFRNELTNLISQYFLTLDDNTTVYYSSNRGKIQTHGVEAAFNYYPGKRLNISLSGSYQNSEDKTEGIQHFDVAYSPEWLGYLKVSYAFKPNYSFFLRGRFVSSMQTEYDYEKQARLGQEVDSYSEWSAGFAIKNTPVNGLKWSLNITNLFNTDIHHPATTLNQFADKGLLDFPTRYFVGIKYEF